MKAKMNRLKYGLLSILFLCFLFSCNEEEFLKEKPLDFYSLETSYQTKDQFEKALTKLYTIVREIHYNGDNTNYFAYLTATDLAFAARKTTAYFGDYDVWLVPNNSMVDYHWKTWYKVVANANTIISRLNESELTDSEKSLIGAEAKFFRAFAYRHLVYLYGRVPLVLDEVSSPKTDFVQAGKDEVLNQMILDFEDAANNLPSINEVADGKVSNLVANHYLAETYISTQEYDKAITASSIVLNDPNVHLMKERFGRRISEPENVFWDLFQRENQNRSKGNAEALWVIQMETDVPGGLITTTTAKKNQLERYAGTTSFGSAVMAPDGKPGNIGLAVSDYDFGCGGQGVAFMQNTDYFLNTLWQSDWNNDIRNSPHNIVRDYKYNNPNSAYYGKSALEFRSPTFDQVSWRWYPWPSKITTVGDHPDGVYLDKDKKTLNSAVAGSTYRDMYMLRLAETYLLRAEAYLGKGNSLNAANDINMVRSRSKANPVSAGDVTLDYILDERGRELVYEEQRRITLHRVNKLVERVRKCNPWNADEIKDFHGLWPIPISEIEANKDAVMEQNPGY